MPLGEIVVVVENDHLVRGDFILCHELFDGAARGVHVRHGAGDNDLFAVHEGFGDGGFALLLLEFGIERFGGVPRCQKAHVVEGLFVLFFGVAEPHDEIHMLFLPEKMPAALRRRFGMLQ